MTIRPLVLLTTLSLALLGASESNATVVAHWEFTPGANYLNDSSGHGYDLVSSGVAGFSVPTSSTDVPATASVTGSAQFNGTSAFAQTAIPLSLSGYGAVRFSYWIKVETTATDLMLFENSFDSNFKVNAGSTFHYFNYNGTGALVAYRTNGTGFPSEATTLDYANYNTTDEWHFIQVDYDFTIPADNSDRPNTVDKRVVLQTDGVAGVKIRSIFGEPENVWTRLRDDFLYVGGRREFSGNPDILYKGKIADVKIEGFFPSLIGDYTNNGVVDAEDYVAWRKNEGTTNVLANDPIGGTIGQSQLDQWRANYGKTVAAGNGLAASSVPEPSSLFASLASGLTVAFSLRRRCVRKYRRLTA